MRVIGGTEKGRLLSPFNHILIKPTKDMVREAVFDMMQASFPCGPVLDLFAGTGAMGIEAMSRGAESALFIDVDKYAVALIKKNLKICRFTERTRVWKMSVASALRRLGQKEERFDLVFLDPPYLQSIPILSVDLIIEEGILKHGGLMVVESPKKDSDFAEVDGLLILKKKIYGDTAISLYGRQ